MLKWFKYLRIVTALLLIVIAISNFTVDLYYQSKSMLDGPLAWFYEYSFAINKVVLAIFLSVILIFDFEITLPKWGSLFLKIFGIAALILAVISLAYWVRHQVFSGMHKGLVWYYAEQFAYILVSLIILSKGFEEKLNA